MINTWRRWRIHHGPGTPAMGDQTWKASFASDDRHHVNQHFGMASGFCVFEIAPGASRLIEVLRSPLSDNHNGRIGERIQMLQGCRLLFCVAIGESARRQLASNGITAMVVATGVTISSLLIKLQEQPARGTLAPFKTALSPKLAEERFVAMLANGWDE